MRLVDYDPQWVSEGNRQGMGVRFRCPHCETNLVIWFSNPLDKGQPPDRIRHRAPLWKRTGDTFETLSLVPSINAIGHWHGMVSNGDLITAQ